MCRNATGLDTTAVEAAYLIDAALPKGHVSSGVSLCAKNLFGATSIHTDWHKNAHDLLRQPWFELPYAVAVLHPTV